MPSAASVETVCNAGIPATRAHVTARLRRKAVRIDRSLAAFYGEPRRRRRLDPLSLLVATILSQNTTDTNSGRAFDRLRARFPSWDAARTAPVRAVVAAIRPAGLAAVKGPRIQGILRRIVSERGVLSLDFLRQWPAARAGEWLRALDGVGPKTAAIVLVFGLGKPAFAVDTHVYRVGRRLGLIPERLSPEAAHDWMDAAVRPARHGPFHLLLVRHGREICKAQRPRCPICPVRGSCDFFRGHARRVDGSRHASCGKSRRAGGILTRTRAPKS